MRTLLFVVLTLTSINAFAETPAEKRFRQCVEACVAEADQPGYQLRACIEKCRKLNDFDLLQEELLQDVSLER